MEHGLIVDVAHCVIQLRQVGKLSGLFLFNVVCMLAVLYKCIVMLIILNIRAVRNIYNQTQNR